MDQEKIILSDADKKLAEAIAKIKKLSVEEIEACLEDARLRGQYLEQIKKMFKKELKKRKNNADLIEKVESPFQNMPKEERAKLLDEVTQGL